MAEDNTKPGKPKLPATKSAAPKPPAAAKPASARPKAPVAVPEARSATKTPTSSRAQPKAGRRAADAASPARSAANVVAAKKRAVKSPVAAAPLPLPEAITPDDTARRRRSRARKQPVHKAKFGIGQVVRHRFYPFRGVVFDIDPVFANTEEWWRSIPPELRPRKDQPFYHLLAENDETEYIAYVSEQNLLPDETGAPLRHPQVSEMFVEDDDGRLHAVFMQAH